MPDDESMHAGVERKAVNTFGDARVKKTNKFYKNARNVMVSNKDRSDDVPYNPAAVATRTYFVLCPSLEALQRHAYHENDLTLRIPDK